MNNPVFEYDENDDVPENENKHAKINSFFLTIKKDESTNMLLQ